MIKALSPRTSAAKPGTNQAGPLVFAIFLLLGGAFFFFLVVRPFFLGMAARNWVETPCRVVSSTVKVSDSSDGTTYRPDIVYTYEVSGRKYQSNRYQFLEFSSSGRESKARVVARYPRGKTAVCRVNPKNPHEAVLDPNPIPAGFVALFPLLFMAAGAWGLVWSIRAKAKARAVDAAVAATGEPWKARPDWAAGRVVSSSKGALGMIWAFAGAWNAISTPIAWTVVRDNVLHRPLSPAAFVLLFPLVGLGLLCGAVYLTLRWLRFGESAFEMKELPAVPGGMVEGTVRLKSPIRPNGPVRLRLHCMARETQRTSDGTTTVERLVWQREETGELAPTGDAFSVAIPLPSSAAATTSWKGENGFFWRLEAKASLPGVDYKAQFELPVCAGELSPETAAEAEAARARETAEVAAYVPPASSRVRITMPLRGGVEFFFPPGRSLAGTAIGLAMAAGMVWGIGQMVAHQERADAFWLGVALVIPGFMLAYIWTHLSRVTVEGGMVTVTRKFLGISKTRTVAVVDITDVKTRINSTSTGPGGTTVFRDLVIVLGDEDEINVGGRIPDQREAQWLAAQMLAAIRKP